MNLNINWNIRNSVLFINEFRLYETTGCVLLKRDVSHHFNHLEHPLHSRMELNAQYCQQIN